MIRPKSSYWKVLVQPRASVSVAIRPLAYVKLLVARISSSMISERNPSYSPLGEYT